MTLPPASGPTLCHLPRNLRWPSEHRRGPYILSRCFGCDVWGSLSQENGADHLTHHVPDGRVCLVGLVLHAQPRALNWRWDLPLSVTYLSLWWKIRSTPSKDPPCWFYFIFYFFIFIFCPELFRTQPNKSHLVERQVCSAWMSNVNGFGKMCGLNYRLC